jgi:hypothetical protein
MALLRWIYLRKLMPIEELLAGAAPASKPLPASRPAAKDVASGFSRTGAPAPPAPPRVAGAPTPPAPAARAEALTDAGVKDALLAEIRKTKAVLYNTVVVQAQKIEVSGDRATFTFSATQRALREAVEQNRGWLETLAQQVAGRRIAVMSVQLEAGAPAAPAATTPAAASTDAAKADRKAALKEQALADGSVQALLEVFPAEIRDVEEM